MFPQLRFFQTSSFSGQVCLEVFFSLAFCLVYSHITSHFTVLPQFRTELSRRLVLVIQSRCLCGSNVNTVTTLLLTLKRFGNCPTVLRSHQTHFTPDSQKVLSLDKLPIPHTRLIIVTSVYQCDRR